MDNNYFSRLNQVNVSDHIEHKGEFAYLSWPYAVAQLRLADPAATWDVRRFDGLPYLKTETGFFVEVAVTVQGLTLSQIHPVLDGKNKPIYEPTAFDINTSIQRCLVKAIALHGLGLYVYAGEDLPEGESVKPTPPKAPVAPINSTRVTPAQLRYIERLIDETGSDLGKVLDYFGVAALTELSSHAASRTITSLDKQRRAA